MHQKNINDRDGDEDGNSFGHLHTPPNINQINKSFNPLQPKPTNRVVTENKTRKEKKK